MAESARVGSQFGQYQLRALLGRGGMGEVYEAYDTVKDRIVALKILRADLAQDPSYQHRFRRESHAAARLRDPHVIPIHDWGEIDGVLYIDMRLVAGQDLRSLLRASGPMDPVRAVSIIGQIAEALDAAHSDGLIHRDVKPENILVTASEFAYLVDFGIAHSSADLRLTTVGSTVGSYAYMAPERFGNAPVGAPVDVYSLACVLYECLTGSIPFPSDSISSAIHAHLTAPIPRPSAIRPGLPPAFDEVIARGLAKNPLERYSTTADFASAARSALSRGERRTETGTAPVPAPSPGREFRPTSIDGLGRPPIHPPSDFHDGRPDRRSVAVPVVVTLLVIALLTLGGVIGWLLLDRKGSGTATVTATTIDHSSLPATQGSPAAAPASTAPEPVSPTPAPSTTPASSTTPAPTTTVPLPPVIGRVSGADQQGFLSPASARCNYTNPAIFIGRTTASLVVVCRTGVGRYYYQGVRISDGASISIDDPVPSGTGFVATHAGDGTRYQISTSMLTIVDGNGQVLAAEPMIEAAHR